MEKIISSPSPSRYGYVYLSHEKSQSLIVLDVEVERQLDRKVKIVNLIGVVNFMEGMMKLDIILVHLLNSSKGMAYVLNIQARYTRAKWCCRKA